MLSGVCGRGFGRNWSRRHCAPWRVSLRSSRASLRPQIRCKLGNSPTHPDITVRPDLRQHLELVVLTRIGLAPAFSRVPAAWRTQTTWRAQLRPPDLSNCKRLGSNFLRRACPGSTRGQSGADLAPNKGRPRAEPRPTRSRSCWDDRVRSRDDARPSRCESEVDNGPMDGRLGVDLGPTCGRLEVGARWIQSRRPRVHPRSFRSQGVEAVSVRKRSKIDRESPGCRNDHLRGRRPATLA